MRGGWRISLVAGKLFCFVLLLPLRSENAGVAGKRRSTTGTENSRRIRTPREVRAFQIARRSFPPIGRNFPNRFDAIFPK